MELVGVAEVAEMLGVSRSYVNRLARQGKLPEPLGEITAGRVWRRDDVEAWAQSGGKVIDGT